MGYIILDTQLYLKAIVMLTEYLMLKTQNPKVDMYLLWVEQQFHGNPQNKRLLPDPQWNLSL